MSLHKNSHDLKFGGEFIFVTNKGDWFIQQVGRMIFNSIPANITRSSRASIPRHGTSRRSPARRCASSIRTSIDDWSIDVPRPTWALWFGDNWRVTNQLTLNYGVRWDVDWGVASPPDVVTNSILINNNAAATGKDLPGLTGTDFGFKDGIRDNRNIAPRAGFTYNVNGNNDFVIRGGTGLYFTTPVSNMTFSPQIYSQMVTAAFLPPASGRCPDGSLWMTNPACGITSFAQAKAVAPAQSPRIISPDYRIPIPGRAASVSRSRSTR